MGTVPSERTRPVTQPEIPAQAAAVSAANVAASGDAAAGVTPAATLPGVLADVPVAVLVIDRETSAVTYANTAAVELAGTVALPVDIDRWGAAAGLTDLDGAPLASSRGPLSTIAQGRPVTGEAVRLSPGRSTDEARADAGHRDQLLWVTGFPLSQEGSVQRLALVVFLRVDADRPDADQDAYLQALREQAVVATDIAFTITDPRRPDNPLVWTNPAFTRMTGYPAEDVVGRNCRLLQGPATDPAAVAAIRAGLREHRTVTTTLLNYRADGTAFWNHLSISPVFDGEGELVSYVGVQTDVTERVRAESQREAAFAAEQAARHEAELARSIAEQARSDAERAQADAERAQGRLALMAEASTALVVTLDMVELLERLIGLCVPRVADWGFVTVVDDSGEVAEFAGLHRDGLVDDLADFAARHVRHLGAGSPSRRSMATSRPVLLDGLSAEDRAAIFTSPGALEAFDRLGGASVLTVPMRARRRTLGAIALVRSSGRPAFGPADVEVVTDFASRAALAIDNVRLYRREHMVADTLQRSLLPDLPVVPGVEAAAHYVSASTAADVGGDFYDLLDLPDGSVGIAVGDVVGHDVAAAAAMGHLRGVLRAVVWEAADGDPATVLARVDRLVQGLQVAALATLVYARAVRPVAPGGPWTLHLASAGHPPVLLRDPSGVVRPVDGVGGLLVGVDASTRRATTAIEVPAGSTLVAYTDGLVERSGHDLDEGIAELCARIAQAPVDAPPRDLCDAAVTGALDHRDDVALIAVRFG